MKQTEYEESFKVEVIKAYLESPHGVRVIARTYGLPSKNYIERWMKELKRKRLISQDAFKSNGKSSMKKSYDKPENPYSPNKKTDREKQLEKEIVRLKAENELLKKLKELGRRDPQSK